MVRLARNRLNVINTAFVLIVRQFANPLSHIGMPPTNGVISLVMPGPDKIIASEVMAEPSTVSLSL